MLCVLHCRQDSQRQHLKICSYMSACSNQAYRVYLIIRMALRVHTVEQFESKKYLHGGISYNSTVYFCFYLTLYLEHIIAASSFGPYSRGWGGFIIYAATIFNSPTLPSLKAAKKISKSITTYRPHFICPGISPKRER